MDRERDARVGRSTGDWRQETLADYAADAAGGLATLRADPRIDHARIGVVGHSQGGWIAPLAAQRDGGVAFLILLSGTPLTPLEQSVYAVEVSLRQDGLDSLHLPRALRLVRMAYSVYLTNSDWDAARRAIDSASTEPWFDPRAFGLQPDTAWNVRWLRELPFDFDVAPSLGAFRGPVLTVNGSEDPLVPAERSRDQFQALARASAADITSRVIAGVGHRLGRRDRDAPDDATWASIISWLEPRLRP